MLRKVTVRDLHKGWPTLEWLLLRGIRDDPAEFGEKSQKPEESVKARSQLIFNLSAFGIGNPYQFIVQGKLGLASSRLRLEVISLL